MTAQNQKIRNGSSFRCACDSACACGDHHQDCHVRGHVGPQQWRHPSSESPTDFPRAYPPPMSPKSSWSKFDQADFFKFFSKKIAPTFGAFHDCEADECICPAPYKLAPANVPPLDSEIATSPTQHGVLKLRPRRPQPLHLPFLWAWWKGHAQAQEGQGAEKVCLV